MRWPIRRVQKRVRPTLGMTILPREQQTPQALRDFHKAEIDKWWPIIKVVRHQGAIDRNG